MGEEGRSLTDTPTWAVATVITFMVIVGFTIHGSFKIFEKWLDKTKRKSLLLALYKIKEELMLFGVMSLLMGHWIEFVAKICVKSSALSSRFYPCALEKELESEQHILLSNLKYVNRSLSRELIETGWHEHCPEGHESFASEKSLEQLHRLIFVLGVTHVFYSFASIALAMIKIYSWRVWENQAKSMAIQSLEGSSHSVPNNIKMARLSTFTSHHTSHPWSRHRILIWLLCFSRQFWSSISQVDYMALRIGFITTHQLPLSYDFLNYMLRSMEDEFCDIVGISVPLWIYTILCIFLDFHGTDIYFWLSFLPAMLILVIGTKLYHVVVKLAAEISEASPSVGNSQFKLRDELFWFGKPRLLLHFIQMILFQNAFEMATVIWSTWEIKNPSCFMDNRRFLVVRLIFGVISQFWCSFIIFPLYVIITQMGSRYKQSVISENIRSSLHGWKRRAKSNHSSFVAVNESTSASPADQTYELDSHASNSMDGNLAGANVSHEEIPVTLGQLFQINEIVSAAEEKLQLPQDNSPPRFRYYKDDEHFNRDNEKAESCLLPP